MRNYKIINICKIILIIFILLVSLLDKTDINGTESVIEMEENSYNNANLIFPVIYINKLNLIKSINIFKNEMIKIDESTIEVTATDAEIFLTVSVEDINTNNDVKLAFLTFDDGPSENVTPRILDILDEYNIKATFFVLGSMCDKNDKVLKDIYDKKHSIGNHSYSHVYKNVYKDEANFINEVKLTDQTLKRILGDDFSTRLFRFPGGSFESYKKQFIKPLNKTGYISIDWNALTGDSEISKPTPDKLMNRLKSTLKNKNNVIILMHDTDAKQLTADILPNVIEYLKSEGYKFAVIK